MDSCGRKIRHSNVGMHHVYLVVLSRKMFGKLVLAVE
jgi:hypothetical protein